MQLFSNLPVTADAHEGVVTARSESNHKADLAVACSNCGLRELCIPIGMDAQELQKIDNLVLKRPRIKRAGHLFRVGEAFTSLYAVRSGFFKTCITTQDGREQVTGFHMAGDIIGVDGIVNNQHACDAVALEDSEVCVLPFERMEEIAFEVKALQHRVHKILSGEIVRNQGVMQMLGSMKAEERIAEFLLNLAQRLNLRGFSKSDLVLRMTREEIGSYLGLTIETVSRTFSKLADAGTIEVNQRHIRVRDAEALKRIVHPPGCH